MNETFTFSQLINFPKILFAQIQCVCHGSFGTAVKLKIYIYACLSQCVALANATDELCANVQTKVILSTFSHNLTDDTSLFKVFVLDFINEDVELEKVYGGENSYRIINVILSAVTGEKNG